MVCCLRWLDFDLLSCYCFSIVCVLLCCHCRVFVGMVVLVSFSAVCMVLVDCCCWLFGFGVIGYCDLLVC